MQGKSSILVIISLVETDWRQSGIAKVPSMSVSEGLIMLQTGKADKTTDPAVEFKTR